MGCEMEEFIRELEGRISEETREAYGDAAFERWQNLRYMGVLEEPDGYGLLTGSCGDTMEIFLKFEKERVVEARFRTEGCGSSAVCGSFAAEIALGKSPDELLDVTADAILEKLGGLPKEEEHCATLAAATLQEALDNFMLKRSKP